MNNNSERIKELKLQKSEITKELNKLLLKDTYMLDLTIYNKDILQIIADEFSQNVTTISIPYRGRDARLLKLMTTLVLRDKLGYTYNKIGYIMNIDHSAAVHRYKIIKKYINNDEYINIKYTNICNKIDKM